MEKEKVIAFLIKAKKETYAGEGPEVQQTRPKSHNLEYMKGDLLYIDTYLGAKNFAGEEALWENGNPFWAMNYVGRVLGKGFDSSFLKEALLNVPFDLPFRGPAEYKKGENLYKCSVEGCFEWFIGFEEIYYRDEKAYECRFHGGILK